MQEFGAVTGIFVPDAITKSYVYSRRRRVRKSSALYFKPDNDAVYAQTFEIDLSSIGPLMALYPSPDNVVPVAQKAGLKLDGCFIGACTTTEEDLVLAALVLKAGLAGGLAIVPGIRHVTPGSLPIVQRLKLLGLLQVYEDAGYTIGAPGCSYCVGVADTAPVGTTWLTSQNRNFPNRIGKGSFANLASATTVAASSFSMTIADPSPLLKRIDVAVWAEYKKLTNAQRRGGKPGGEELAMPKYLEPAYEHAVARNVVVAHGNAALSNPSQARQPIRSRVVTLGDFIDTDAVGVDRPSHFTPPVISV